MTFILGKLLNKNTLKISVIIGVFVYIFFLNTSINSKKIELVEQRKTIQEYKISNETLMDRNKELSLINDDNLVIINKLRNQEPETVTVYKDRIVRVQDDCKEIINDMLGDSNEKAIDSDDTILNNLNGLF
ncbi:hypothetical protein [uncultured Arcobacter sp.]|uniref:hypothetical protein n=1 Tax=uncultured Arcobacter sp. TaxID=165434 RepID=UPI00260280FB|nr:hypothetical protein [uncultured Arcobacter sp.]